MAGSRDESRSYDDRSNRAANLRIDTRAVAPAGINSRSNSIGSSALSPPWGTGENITLILIIHTDDIRTKTK